MSGFVSFVGAGPGAADLLTLRAVRTLASADVVLHDALVSQEVLNCAAPTALRIDVGKRCGGGGRGQRRIEALLVEHASAGRRVVRLKGGDVGLFGRLAEEIDALVAAGIGYSIVPGITAGSAAAAAVGVPLTDRHRAPTVRFVSASRMDDDASARWADDLTPAQTLVVYMAGRRLGQIARDLLARQFPPQLPVAIVGNASLADQRIARRSLMSLARATASDDMAPSPRATLLIIGEVLRCAPERADG